MKASAVNEAIEIVRDSMMDYRSAASENEKNAAASLVIKWSKILLDLPEPKNAILADRLRAMIQASQSFLYRREKQLLESM